MGTQEPCALHSEAGVGPRRHKLVCLFLVSFLLVIHLVRSPDLQTSSPCREGVGQPRPWASG